MVWYGMVWYCIVMYSDYYMLRVFKILFLFTSVWYHITRASESAREFEAIFEAMLLFLKNTENVSRKTSDNYTSNMIC